MDYNYNNPYSFPWNPPNLYLPNGYTPPRPIVPHQQTPPGFPGVIYGPQRFPGGVFPFGINDQNSQFGMNWNNYGNFQNPIQQDQRPPHGSSVNNLNTGVNASSNNMSVNGNICDTLVKKDAECKENQDSLVKESDQESDKINEIAKKVSSMLSDKNIVLKNAISNVPVSVEVQSGSTATALGASSSSSGDSDPNVNKYESDTESETSDENGDVLPNKSGRYILYNWYLRLPNCFTWKLVSIFCMYMYVYLHENLTYNFDVHVFIFSDLKMTSSYSST